MVIFAGARCALISPATPCYWDNILQSFQGNGCVPAPVQQCACRHLTDFAGASAPSIPMCSLSDLTSFDFGDVVQKLTLLLEARLRCQACPPALGTDALLPRNRPRGR